MKKGCTKSNGQKDIFDRFYTKDNIVDLCLDKLDLSKYDCIIEPSAGAGAFSNKIPNCFAYDIEPANDNIIKADWFLLDKSIFSNYNNILVVGNPPFGKQNILAIKFFNEAALFANTIAFILPMSFHKDSIKNRLNLFFHLTTEIVLPACEFELLGEVNRKVNCVFQIWEKREIKREIIKNTSSALKSSLFKFVDKKDADFCIRRVGFSAGKASKNKNVTSGSNYFVKNISSYTVDDLISLINNIDFNESNYTVGPKSLSKGELIVLTEKEILSK